MPVAAEVAPAEVVGQWRDHPMVERPLRWPPSGDLDLGRIVARRE